MNITDEFYNVKYASANLKIKRAREILSKLKAKTPCKDCKVQFPPEAMDFDHVRGQKKFSLASPATFSGRAIAAEIAKCEIVCANCHRIRTRQRRIAKNELLA